MKKKSFQLRTLLMGALTLVLLLSTPAVLAQTTQPQVNIQIQPAFEGNFKYGEWLLLWVTLENQGQDLEVEITTSIEQSGGGGIYAAEVSLPAGSRKQVPFYVIPNNFSRELEIQVTSDNTEIASEVVQVFPNQNNYYLIGVASPETGPVSQITTIQNGNSSRKTAIFNLFPDLLPEKQIALKSLDAIILNDTDTSQLTIEQKNALAAWVQDGGRLILGGGPGLEKTAIGLPEELLPFSTNSLVEADSLSGLEIFANGEPILVNGPFVVNEISTTTGAELAAQDSLSLVHEWAIGNGYLNLVSLDLTTSPFNAWSGTTQFWENILSPGSAFPINLPPDTSIRQMRAGSMYYPLTNQPSLDLPSVRSLGILLLIYILLVGPVNYLFLRWRNKFQLAWITIPVLTAMFTAGAFGLAFILRGNDILVNNISIINLMPGGTANITGYVGVFSPAQSTYTLEVTGSPLLSPSSQGYYDPWSSYSPTGTGEARFYQGNPAKVTGLNVDQWSLNSFNIESLTTQMGEIKTDLILQKGKLTGTIENQMPYTIQGAVLVFGMETEIIGDLEPYETKEVEISFSKDTRVRGAPTTYQIIEKAAAGTETVTYSREYDQKRSILDGVFQPYGYWMGPASGINTNQIGDPFQLNSTYLVGWLDNAPIEISIDGKTANQKSLSLLTFYLPLAIDPTGFTLPPSSIPGKLSTTNSNTGYCGGSETYIYLENGETSFDFSIPSNLIPTTINSLILDVWDDQQWDSQTTNLLLSIYNWESNTWVEFDEIINGQNIITDPVGLVSADGSIQINLEKTENNFGGCVYLGLGVEGSQDN